MSHFLSIKLTRLAHFASAVAALGWLVGVGSTHAQCPAAAVSTPLSGTYRDLSIAVPGFENDPIYGSKTAFVYIPSSYQATRPMPLFILLHGAAGNPTLAIGQASQFRGFWAGAAEAGEFIIALPAASGTQGSWIAPTNETDTPSDYDVIQALAERLALDYNVDRARRYLWGFSAGGHVTIDIALNRFHRRINGDYFAGFAVNAGVSAGLACAGIASAACNSEVFAKGSNHRPIDIRIGQTDTLFSRAVDDRPRFLANGWAEGVTFFWHPFAGGHTVLSDQPLQIWNNLCGFRNEPAKLTSVNALPIRLQVDSSVNRGRRAESRSAPIKSNLGLRAQERKR